METEHRGWNVRMLRCYYINIVRQFSRSIQLKESKLMKRHAARNVTTRIRPNCAYCKGGKCVRRAKRIQFFPSESLTKFSLDFLASLIINGKTKIR